MLDGLDLDWEHPVCCGMQGNGVHPNDWANYVLLLQAIRSQYGVVFGEANALELVLDEFGS